MKITRRGSAADHGESNIELGEPAFAWRKSDSCLTIKQSRVKDFSTKSRHSYTVCIKAPELNALIQALSDAAISDPGSFEKALEPSLKALVRIQAVVAGVKT
ncbi:hypothetical protein KJ965_04820 [Patescibacteria group bacterium]|nr:hypothetical protein [Patescibacteria group bacterium]